MINHYYSLSHLSQMNMGNRVPNFPATSGGHQYARGLYGSDGSGSFGQPSISKEQQHSIYEPAVPSKGMPDVPSSLELHRTVGSDGGHSLGLASTSDKQSPYELAPYEGQAGQAPASGPLRTAKKSTRLTSSSRSKSRSGGPSMARNTAGRRHVGSRAEVTAGLRIDGRDDEEDKVLGLEQLKIECPDWHNLCAILKHIIHFNVWEAPFHNPMPEMVDNW